MVSVMRNYCISGDLSCTTGCSLCARLITVCFLGRVHCLIQVLCIAGWFAGSGPDNGMLQHVFNWFMVGWLNKQSDN